MENEPLGSVSLSLTAGKLIVPLAGMSPAGVGAWGGTSTEVPSLHAAVPVPVVTTRLPCESTAPVRTRCRCTTPWCSLYLRIPARCRCR